MHKKYLNLSTEIQNYIDFAVADGNISSNEIELIKRKAIEFGDDPIEVELVLSKVLLDLENDRKQGAVEYIEKKPKYGLIDSYIFAIKNYSNFKGRASRSQFWYYILFSFIIFLALLIITGMLVDKFEKNVDIILLPTLMIFVFPLFSVVPFLSICTRRLHDTNKPGWLMLIPIYNIILFCTKGAKINNKYGADPYQSFKIEKKDNNHTILNKLRSSTIETVGATMFGIGATSHEAIELKLINYHQLDHVNKWLWLIGGILIFVPKTYKFLFRRKL